MTAKEMKIESTIALPGGTQIMFDPEDFQAFCEQLCWEQREICDNAIWDADTSEYNFSINDLSKAVLNALMPEL